MKLILRLTVAALFVLIGIILFNTFTFKAKSYYSTAPTSTISVDPAVLGEALRFKTISHKAEMIDDSVFIGFHQFLDSVFPLCHQLLKKEVFNQYALMYTLKGSETELDPVVIMAHQDVVPAEYSTLNEWHYPPFSGTITDKYIYGRGALDDKGSMIAILSALEALLEKGYTPQRTLLFCFGHDEEIGGEDGGKTIAQVLKDRGTRAYAVIDEGGNMVSGIVPGIEKPVALIGTAEKGYMSIEISANVSGGHSSMPEKTTAVVALNKALYKLNENPFPNMISPPLEGFIDHVGPNLPFIQKMAFANTWLFKPLIFSVYEKSASGSALIHTTQAITIFQAGIKDNVIPKRAKATINFRLLPGDEPDEVLRRTRELINDTLVKVAIFESFAAPASPVSDYKSKQFERLAGSISSCFPDAIVSPYLVIAATDARYFYNISNHVFRFAPITLTKDDLPRLHGVNERISIEDFKKSVNFYAALIKEFSK
jgi:carboxypeptidase PM20D1